MTGRNILAAGNAARRFADAANNTKLDIVPEDNGLPDAIDVATLAARQAKDLQIRKGDDWTLDLPVSSPLYLKPPDVTPPAKQNKNSGRDNGRSNSN